MRPCSTPASKQKRAQLLRGQLQGKSGTRCAQAAGFLFLSTTLAGPADRFACKSFAADAGRGRGSLIVTLPLLLLLLLKNIVPRNPHWWRSDASPSMAHPALGASSAVADSHRDSCSKPSPSSPPFTPSTPVQYRSFSPSLAAPARERQPPKGPYSRQSKTVPLLQRAPKAARPE